MSHPVVEAPTVVFSEHKPHLLTLFKYVTDLLHIWFYFEQSIDIKTELQFETIQLTNVKAAVSPHFVYCL